MSCNVVNFTRQDCGIACFVGATFQAHLEWEYESPAGSGTYLPVDLTGYTAKMQVRPSPGGTLIVDLNTTNGRIVLGNGGINFIDLSIDAADTVLLVPGIYKYDFHVFDSFGVVSVLFSGTFEIVNSISEGITV